MKRAAKSERQIFHLSGEGVVAGGGGGWRARRCTLEIRGRCTVVNEKTSYEIINRDRLRPMKREFPNQAVLRSICGVFYCFLLSIITIFPFPCMMHTK